MNPATVTRIRESAGKPCCARTVADVDVSVTAGKVREALGLPVTARLSRAIQHYTEKGLYLMTYAFTLAVYGREWCGPQRPGDGELVNQEYWR